MALTLHAALVLRAGGETDALAAGTCRLTAEGERFTLEANAAPLPVVIETIARSVGGTIRVSEMPERAVTARYRDVTLEQMLDRLDVNYVLSYERRPEDAGYRVSDAWVFEGASPELRAFLSGARRAIAALRDDDTRFNALNVMEELCRAGKKVIPELEAALRSDDYQTRQFAAEVLAGFSDAYRPSEAFVDVMVEGLADDSFPAGTNRQGQAAYVYVNNARRGYEYFLVRPELIDQYEFKFAAHLGAGDAQRRFLCALLLAERGKVAYLDRLANILIPHLADNRLSSDGGLAAYALYRLGPGVRRYLEPYAASADVQQARLAALILWHLDHPGETPEPDPSVRGMNRAVSDPVLYRTPISFDGWAPENFPDENGRYGAR